MLTNERVDALINECATFGRDVPKDGSIQWMKRAEIYKLCAAVATEAQAATLATVTPLVQRFMDAHNYVKHTPGEQYDEKHGAKLMNDAANAGSAFLSGATKENTDIGATIEWQVRGRHHYEWRRASEEIARAMYLVNPGHVRAVTVVEGAVPKSG